MKKSKLTNTTTIDATGKRIIPNLYTETQGDFLPGDILDANSVINTIKQNIGNITNGAPEELDSLQEVSDVITQLNLTIADLLQETDKLKEQLNPTPKHEPTTDRSLANVGDIVVAHWSDDMGDIFKELIFIDPLWFKRYREINNWQHDLYQEELSAMPGDMLMAIGIVVVPASHTTDNTIKIVSLKYMDYQNEDGSDIPVQMVWGPNTNNLPENIKFDKIVTYRLDTTNVSITYSDGKIPTSDKEVDYTQNPDDPNTNWDAQYRYQRVVPSPYNINGLLNDIWNTNNLVLTLRDGKYLTQEILNSSNWSIGDTVTNNTFTEEFDDYEMTDVPTADNPNMYTAAFSCLNYTPAILAYEGTNHEEKVYPFNAGEKFGTEFGRGSWYLPSIGELLYLNARLKLINNAREVLGLDPIVLPSHCSNVSRSTYHIWSIDSTANGVSYDCYINSDKCVLAFASC